jgi:hypothetical protein
MQFLSELQNRPRVDGDEVPEAGNNGAVEVNCICLIRQEPLEPFVKPPMWISRGSIRIIRYESQRHFVEQTANRRVSESVSLGYLGNFLVTYHRGRQSKVT